MHPAGCLGAVMGPLSQQPHFIQGLASTYSEEHITGVPKSHAVRNETKNEPGAHLAKRNETKPKWAKAHFAKPKRCTKQQYQCPLRETETKQKQVRCSPCAHLSKRNETEMGEIDLEAPFRFIRFFFRFSVPPYSLGSAFRVFRYSVMLPNFSTEFVARHSRVSSSTLM